MKTSLYACITVVVYSLILIAPAGAIQPVKKKAVETQQAPLTTPVLQPQGVTPVQQPVPGQLTPQTQQLPKGMAVQQLPNNITINPAHLQGIKVAAFKGLSPEFYAAWKQVVDNYNAISGNFPSFDQKIKNFVAASQACKTKNYTQQDMVAAGCLPTDTLEACSKKLYEKCIEPQNPELSFIYAVGLVFSFLKDSATTANTEAYNSLMNLKK